MFNRLVHRLLTAVSVFHAEDKVINSTRCGNKHYVSAIVSKSHIMDPLQTLISLFLKETSCRTTQSISNL
jgi:hypothetical protein